MIRILREFNNVVVPGGHWDGVTFHKNHAASASFAELNNDQYLFFRGVASGHMSKIGRYKYTPANHTAFDKHRWDDKYFAVNSTNAPYNPRLVPGSQGNAQDDYSLNAPCATVRMVNNTPTIFVYYDGKWEEAIGEDEVEINDTLMVATSADGINFTKQDSVRSVAGTEVRLPFVNVAVCTIGNTTYMVGAHVETLNNNKSCRPMLYSSTDGYVFGKICDMIYCGPTNAWDSQSIQPTRLFYNEPYLYMIYCASGAFFDYPEGIGLARANINNLTTWEKYPSNPIMLRGSSGMYDEGGVWAPAFQVFNGKIHVFYEGFGGGGYVPGSARSRKTRKLAYGGIHVDGPEDALTEYSCSTLLHGLLNVNASKLNSEWSNQQISGNVQIKDPVSGKYMSLSSTTGDAATLTNTATTLNLTRARSGTGANANNDALMYIKSGTKMLGINRTENQNDMKDLILLETLTAPTDLPDRKGEFLFYQVSEHIYQIQNRYSGLFLCPKTINGITYVGQGLDNGSNQTFWQVENVT